MGKFSSDDILNIRHNYNKEVESKTAYCKRLAEKYNVDKTMIRQILNNQKYYDPNYTPYMPGGSNKVTKEDVDKIRDDYLKHYNGKRTIEDFIDDLQYRYNVTTTDPGDIALDKKNNTSTSGFTNHSIKI